VHHDRARLAHADVVVPRREEAPEVRVHRGGPGGRARAKRGAEAARARAAHVVHALSPLRRYVFDAYGTLFDVHSVVEAGREITVDPLTLSATWRQKQLEYTWLRALMGSYVDFWAVTEAALRYAIRRLGLTATDAQLRRLMDAYLSLACFPEVKAALGRLAGRPRAILSNGSPAMLAAAVPASGLGAMLGHVISVDRGKSYEPPPRAYP